VACHRDLPVILLLLLLACHPPTESGLRDTAIDPALDSDGDGIPDLQERSEGTDPGDPASASAWHPEWTDHPRLLTDAGGTAAVLAALEQEGDPWQTLAARIESRCAAEPVAADLTLSSATVNGNIALACALLHLAGDSEAGAKAAGILEVFPTEADIGLSEVYYTDLHAGQGLLQAVRAWDLLQGAGYPQGFDATLAQERLHGLGAFLWDFYVVDYPIWMFYSQNNHATKLAAHLGALGMGAWDDPRSARYVNFAMSELHRLRGVLYASDGSYAEGPSYLVYAAESELPFMTAMDRWLGDGELNLRRVCVHDPDEGCVEEAQLVGSPLRDSRVCDSFERFVELLMPAGYGPNIDDSNLASAHLGLVAGLCDSTAAAWGWEFQAAAYQSAGSVDLSADTLLAWAEAPVGAAPDLQPLLSEEGGWALLRTGWERDDAYLLLLGENGLAREAGKGHEHPDNLSFLWATGGHYLLLDSGYGNWAEHTEVNDAEAHSLFLVDGQGPGDADAWVQSARAEGSFQLASGHTGYQGLDWTRSVVLVGEDVLVILDETAPADGGSLALSLQLQGPNTDFALEQQGGSWNIGDLQLQVAVTAEVDPSLEQRTEQHAFSYSAYQDHAVLQASATIQGPTRWLSVARLAEPGADEGLTVGDEGISWPDGSATLDGQVVLGVEVLEL